jgi:hypothetical protein
VADNDVWPTEAAAVRADLHGARAQVRVDRHKAVQETIASQQPAQKRFWSRQILLLEKRTGPTLKTAPDGGLPQHCVNLSKINKIYLMETIQKSLHLQDFLL